MNKAFFIQQLEQLSSADWTQVAEGRGVLIVDDLRLAVGSANAPNAVIVGSARHGGDASRLRSDSLREAGDLLRNYYLTHPLTKAGFNCQAEALVRQYGAPAFAAKQGELPPYTLFVDGGEVVAESRESPRHKYGVFCELGIPRDVENIDGRIQNWLQRGEAYERYLEMNVCRYNC